MKVAVISFADVARAPHGRMDAEYHIETQENLQAKGAKRLIDLASKYPSHDGESLPQFDPTRPFILIERSVHEETYWLTAHASPDDAGAYHVNQDEPESWSIVGVYDLKFERLMRPTKIIFESGT